MSQSLPCLFRRELVDSEIFNLLREVPEDQLDSYLVELFTSSPLEMLKHALPDREEFGEIEEMASKLTNTVAPPVTYKQMNIEGIARRQTFTN